MKEIIYKDFGEANRKYELDRIEYELALGIMAGREFGNDVLDVGAGKGEFTDMLSKRGYRVNCVEGTKKLFEELKEKGYKSVLVDLEEEKLPFPDNSFDLVVSLEVIEHLWNTDHYLSELKRVVKPNGYVIITTPNYNYWSFRLRAFFGQAEKFLTQDYHKKLFTARSLPQRLAPYFEILKFKGRGMVPKTRKHYATPFFLNFFAMHIGVLCRPKKDI
ncbi:hypothetical protein A2738_03875 [Candidatus Nomurabacteria bacterium RIFCSPHIGHO2_01_FULL_42_15]|uniref:Methyltransferase type 11 domain-containing protein n=1 Tax=Candidatus Nomurabacteria bacterium RIFCSPHIGHO2_01_FULL_42_15 TaxID=1801742 RepID=A0A1F6VEE3_9BACT|nr:MAG: hypothetical protein A2738_03875 [Candidatus Nomurabacteria bacterium RIFCSPHIGHO2_01_FULL_42_15]OGI93342.1 MAG: hypothetical protein A3A99_03730 [Candidatus Nomurabacteria bacterium RIFCSPLOWO2_01_FULL_41_18]